MPLTSSIVELQSRIKNLQDQLEIEYERLRIEFIQQRQILAFRFVEVQRRYKIGICKYVTRSRFTVLLSAPLVYLGWTVFALLDGFVSIFQFVCFPIYGIAKVKRSDYLVFDRSDLPYLNLIEKFNCFYCSYANGVAAYAREVSARTEQYWCPIKHARQLKDAHRNYPNFFEHGDGAAYRKGLEHLRQQYSQNDKHHH